jgi:hypothetical protein
MENFDGLNVEYDCKCDGGSNDCAIPVHDDCVEKMAIDEENNKCVICCERIEDISRFVTLCAHEYHLTCLKKWVELNSLRNRMVACPTCRQDLQHFELRSLNERISWIHQTDGTENEEDRLAREADDEAEEAQMSALEHHNAMGLRHIDGIPRVRHDDAIEADALANAIIIDSSSDEDDDDDDVRMVE